MRMMTQVADGELRQNTPGACGETPTEVNLALKAFNMNQTSALCLPLLSESQKFIWVYSNQVDLQLDGAAELDKAFDRFPYLTQEQTAALAQRCSLHPGQVKVWFMVQRLRYGISWDYDDIREVERKFESGQGKEELQNRMWEEAKEYRRVRKKWKRNVKESGGKKAGKVREEESANEGRMLGVRANEQLERKVKQEQMMNKEKDRKVDNIEEDKRNTQKKWKRMAVTDEMGKKRMKPDDVVERVEEVEIRSDQVEKEGQKFTQFEPTLSTREKENVIKRLMSVQECPADRSFVVPREFLLQAQTQTVNVPPLSDNLTEPLKRADVDLPATPSIGVTPVKSSSEGKVEMETWLERELHAELTNHSVFISGLGKLKELMEVNINPVVDASYTVTPQQDSHVTDTRSLPTRSRCSAKTHTQLMMMKMAFCHCQYPSHSNYDRLATLIGIPRNELVQWFGDMRYYIKKVRPRWMNQVQHSQALANIRYQQCLRTLAKELPSELGGTATWNRKLEMSESSGKDESVKAPPE